MDGKGFQVWLSAARGLTRAQRREALAVLSGRSEARPEYVGLVTKVFSILHQLFDFYKRRNPP